MTDLQGPVHPGVAGLTPYQTGKPIDELTREIHALGMEVLVEVHSHFETQVTVARNVDWVYDFALPPLILHALFGRTAAILKRWFEISPRNTITVLDTHDGIGVIDVGPHSSDEPDSGLLDAGHPAGRIHVADPSADRASTLHQSGRRE